MTTLSINVDINFINAGINNLKRTSIQKVDYETIKKMPHKHDTLGTIQYLILLVKLFPYFDFYNF